VKVIISVSVQNPQNYIESFYKINPEIKEVYAIKRVKFALNLEQRTELIENSKINYIHYLMIKTQLETGLRVNELANLTIKQINFNQDIIQIKTRTGDKYVKAWRTKTLSSNRIIPISKKLKNELKSYIATRKNGYLFISQKKTPFIKNSIIRFINKYAKKCLSIGENIGSHSLRRTYASYMVSEKIEIGKISKMLGHSSIKTTMLYLFDIVSQDFNDVRQVLKKMNKKRR